MKQVKCVTLDKDVIEAVDKLAQEEQRSFSATLNKIAREFLKTDKK